MMTVKKIKKCALVVLMSVAPLVSTGVALGKVLIKDVSLKSGLIDRDVLSAEIIGEVTSQCTGVASVRFGVSPAFTKSKEVNIYLDVNPVDEKAESAMCAEYSAPFMKDVRIGMLEPGYYIFKVYENQIPTYWKGLSIPFDVKSLPLGVDFSRSIGGNSVRSTQITGKS